MISPQEAMDAAYRNKIAEAEMLLSTLRGTIKNHSCQRRRNHAGADGWEYTRDMCAIVDNLRSSIDSLNAR